MLVHINENYNQKRVNALLYNGLYEIDLKRTEDHGWFDKIRNPHARNYFGVIRTFRIFVIIQICNIGSFTLLWFLRTDVCWDKHTPISLTVLTDRGLRDRQSSQSHVLLLVGWHSPQPVHYSALKRYKKHIYTRANTWGNIYQSVFSMLLDRACSVPASRFPSVF